MLKAYNKVYSHPSSNTAKIKNFLMLRRHVSTLQKMTAESFFASAPRYPKDAIFELTAEFKRDPSPVKVNLGQGTYRDNNALPWILPSVVEARRRIFNQKLDHEYLPILGLPDFRNATSRMVLGTDKLASRVRITRTRTRLH